MNNKILALCGFVLAAPYGLVSAAMTSSTGGEIKFTGYLVDTACAVESESANLVVDFNEIRIAQFTGDDPTAAVKPAGVASKARLPFKIKLGGCNPDVSSNASVRFSAVADPDALMSNLPDAGTMIVAGLGAQASSGVALQIFDLSNLPVKVDGLTQTQAITLQPGENEFIFSAGYVSVLPSDQITVGDATATVNFNVDYD